MGRKAITMISKRYLLYHNVRKGGATWAFLLSDIVKDKAMFSQMFSALLLASLTISEISHKFYRSKVTPTRIQSKWKISHLGKRPSEFAFYRSEITNSLFEKIWFGYPNSRSVFFCSHWHFFLLFVLLYFSLYPSFLSPTPLYLSLSLHLSISQDVIHSNELPKQQRQCPHYSIKIPCCVFL